MVTDKRLRQTKRISGQTISSQSQLDTKQHSCGRRGPADRSHVFTADTQ